MQPSEVLEFLLGLAREAGITLRSLPAARDEPPAQTGLCIVRGRPWLLLSASDPVDAKISAAVSALQSHAAALLETRYLPPAVREYLDPR